MAGLAGSDVRTHLLDRRDGGFRVHPASGQAVE
jgi:hypothetical protein